MLDIKIIEHYVQVAAGVVIDADGRVLVALRDVRAHQGGLWEFPGGKVKRGETALQALGRELREEVGIEVRRCFPFKRVYHRYPDKSVSLDVWRVTEWGGTARGCEGQAVKWVMPDELQAADMPAANGTVLRALQLPRYMAITPQVDSIDGLVGLLEHYHTRGVRLLQLRQHHLGAQEYAWWWEKARGYCEGRGMRLLMNQPLEVLEEMRPEYCHLNSRALMGLRARPDFGGGLLSASCHSREELKRAEEIGVDLVLLSPIDGMGWERFEELAAAVSLPVYALGGVGPDDWPRVYQHSGVGLAGIRAFLP